MTPASTKQAQAALLLACLVFGCTACSLNSGKTANLADGSGVSDGSVGPPPLGFTASGMALAKLHANWLADFNDPSMSHWVRTSLKHNQDLKATFARLKAARAAAGIQAANRGPSFALNPRFSRTETQNAQQGIQERINLDLSVNWELDIWSRLGNLEAAAIAEAEANALLFESLRLSLAVRTAAAWLDLTQAELQLNLSEQLSFNQKLLFESVKEAYQNGLLSHQDFLRTRENFQASVAELASRQQARALAAQALELLAGRYPSAELTSSKDLPKLSGAVPAGLPSELLARRWDLRAARKAIEASIHQTNASEKMWLPQLSLTGSSGYNSDALSGLVSSANAVWSLSFNLLQPIFNSGRIRSNIEVARAQQEASVADYRQKVLVAFQEVEAALLGERALRERREALRAIFQDAQTQADAMLRNYREGTAQLSATLELENQALRSKMELLETHGAYLKNRLNLYLALGGDFDAN